MDIDIDMQQGWVGSYSWARWVGGCRGWAGWVAIHVLGWEGQI